MRKKNDNKILLGLKAEILNQTYLKKKKKFHFPVLNKYLV